MKVSAPGYFDLRVERLIICEIMQVADLTCNGRAARTEGVKAVSQTIQWIV